MGQDIPEQFLPHFGYQVFLRRFNIQYKKIRMSVFFDPANNPAQFMTIFERCPIRFYNTVCSLNSVRAALPIARSPVCV